MPRPIPSPFQLFSWRNPFLPALKNFLSAFHGATILIVPNNRPWRYLLEFYKEESQSALLPKILTIDEVVDLWLARDYQGKMASLLDCIALLHQCVQSLVPHDAALKRYFGGMELQHFLPWGKHLNRLADDVFRHMANVQDLQYMEGEVSAPAAALLGALGKICAAYREALTSHGLVTQGLKYALAASTTQNIPALLAPGAYKQVVIAGFCQLDSAEEQLLHALWQAGAHICLHTDIAAFTSQAEGHWACAPHREWISQWGADVAIVSQGENNKAPEMKFFEGYDCHSQLAKLQDDLQRNNSSMEKTAIVFTDSSLLVPVLKIVPADKTNISLGYPLVRSQLAQLLISILGLHARSQIQGAFCWQDILNCLQHPCMFLVYGKQDNGHDFGKHLRLFGQAIRIEPRSVNAESAVSLLKGILPADIAHCILPLAELFLHDIPPTTTCLAICQWIERILSLFPEQDDPIWQSHKLEAEALYRLQHTILPALRDNLLGSTEFSFATIHAIINEHLELERIPFEADPISGLQVIGLLETRLLQFDHVYLVDATEDNLPGNPAQDPLLPDSLRTLVGLPEAHRQEVATAYHLHRLLACAKDVHIYWQEGVSHSTLFDSKKSRSRFVEQWLWDEERARNELIIEERKDSEHLVQTAQCHMEAPVPENRFLAKSPGIAKALDSIFRKKISATQLNAYLQCPLAFARHYLLDLRPADSTDDGDNPAAAGQCIHLILEELYRPFVGNTLDINEIGQQDIERAISKGLNIPDVRNLPADSYLWLEIMARRQLRKFFEVQAKLPSPPLVLELEKECQRTLEANGRAYTLYGRIDRVDIRDNQTYILDYKTGSIHLPQTALWTDDSFFEQVANLVGKPVGRDKKICEELFTTLLEMLPNIQLPMYVTLLAQTSPSVGNACLVELKKDCGEKVLFKNLDEKQLARARVYCDLAIALVLRHMEEVDAFGPDSTGKSCEWCNYAGLCAL